ncbi:hypothetical protein JMM81_12465 [Bacillus sp. V3B]|uniref:hypothetical protein n=1 Tax=Bacillus sp. V3B TaxID=2804915 RepID=UPI002109692B|nr:hypothetical protein [Bacillus sp. V3B]MCQ6275769.1 hypothetical protein [Bacillus sp. V3B]
MDRLEEIENKFNPIEWFEGYYLSAEDIEWLIEEIGRLRIVEQAYEAMKKAL